MMQQMMIESLQYVNHLSELRKLVKAKEKELLKLKASDKNGIIKEA